MGEVTEFPGGRRPPTLPPVADVWASPELRERDAGYVLAALRARLPAEARRHVADVDLASIARAVLLEIDTVRHGRRFNPDYDEHRAGGELGALERLFAGSPAATEPARVEPPAEQPGAPPQGTREAAALAALFGPMPPEPEGAA